VMQAPCAIDREFAVRAWSVHVPFSRRWRRAQDSSLTR
jgi:hypothetical protein